MKLQEIKDILEISRPVMNFKPIKWRYKFFFQKQFPFLKRIKVVDEVEVIDCDWLRRVTIDYSNKKLFGYITKVEIRHEKENQITT